MNDYTRLQSALLHRAADNRRSRFYLSTAGMIVAWIFICAAISAFCNYCIAFW